MLWNAYVWRTRGLRAALSSFSDCNTLSHQIRSWRSVGLTSVCRLTRTFPQCRSRCSNESCVSAIARVRVTWCKMPLACLSVSNCNKRWKNVVRARTRLCTCAGGRGGRWRREQLFARNLEGVNHSDLKTFQRGSRVVKLEDQKQLLIVENVWKGKDTYKKFAATPKPAGCQLSTTLTGTIVLRSFPFMVQIPLLQQMFWVFAFHNGYTESSVRVTLVRTPTCICHHPYKQLPPAFRLLFHFDEIWSAISPVLSQGADFSEISKISLRASGEESSKEGWKPTMGDQCAAIPGNDDFRKNFCKRFLRFIVHRKISFDRYYLKGSKEP